MSTPHHKSYWIMWIDAFLYYINYQNRNMSNWKTRTAFPICINYIFHVTGLFRRYVKRPVAWNGLNQLTINVLSRPKNQSMDFFFICCSLWASILLKGKNKYWERNDIPKLTPEWCHLISDYVIQNLIWISRLKLHVPSGRNNPSIQPLI